MITAFSGTRSDRNTSISRTKLKQDHEEHVGQSLAERVGEVDADGRLSADVHVEPRSARRGGHDVVAEPVHELRRAPVLR